MKRRPDLFSRLRTAATMTKLCERRATLNRHSNARLVLGQIASGAYDFVIVRHFRPLLNFCPLKYTPCFSLSMRVESFHEKRQNSRKRR